MPDGMGYQSYLDEDEERRRKRQRTSEILGIALPAAAGVAGGFSPYVGRGLQAAGAASSIWQDIQAGKRGRRQEDAEELNRMSLARDLDAQYGAVEESDVMPSNQSPDAAPEQYRAADILRLRSDAMKSREDAEKTEAESEIGALEYKAQVADNTASAGMVKQDRVTGGTALGPALPGGLREIQGPQFLELYEAKIGDVDAYYDEAEQQAYLLSRVDPRAAAMQIAALKQERAAHKASIQEDVFGGAVDIDVARLKQHFRARTEKGIAEDRFKGTQLESDTDRYVQDSRSEASHYKDDANLEIAGLRQQGGGGTGSSARARLTPEVAAMERRYRELEQQMLEAHADNQIETVAKIQEILDRMAPALIEAGVEIEAPPEEEQQAPPQAGIPQDPLAGEVFSRQSGKGGNVSVKLPKIGGQRGGQLSPEQMKEADELQRRMQSG